MRRVPSLGWILVPLLLSACQADETTEPIEPETSKTFPTRPDEASAGDGPGATLAVTRYRVGTRTSEGQPSPDAWHAFGYDLDGQITESAGSYPEHCQPAGGAGPRNTFPDAPGGVDNAFGKVLLPILKTALFYGNDQDPETPDVEDFVNGELGRKTSGFVIHLANVGSLPSYDPIDAFLSLSWKNEAGRWALQEQGGAQDFARSYVTDDVWVADGSESAAPLELVWAIDTMVIPFRLHRPIVTLRLSADRQSATDGIVTGILDTEEIIATMRGVVGAADESFCEGTAVEGLMNQIRQASDIMLSGEQDPDAKCNGISMAFGFDADIVELDGVVPQPALPDTVCALDRPQ